MSIRPISLSFFLNSARTQCFFYRTHSTPEEQHRSHLFDFIRSNSTYVAFAWLKNRQRKTEMDVESLCGRAMEVLGYKKWGEVGPSTIPMHEVDFVLR